MYSSMNSVTSKPFAKKTFYLDLKNFPNQAKLAADLKLLGAKEETSLIKSVSFVVSNRASLKPQFQAPCTPLSNSRCMSPHLFPDSALGSPAPAGSPMWEPSPRIMSRNMLILQQAAKKQGGTTDVIEICKMWNIKIYPLQKVLSWVEKYKNLYYKTHMAEQKKHLKKLPKASESIQKLQAPFIKIEDKEGEYKTRYRVFSSWKNVINPSLSQFVSQLRRNAKMFGSVNGPVRPALKEVDVESLHSSNLISTNRTVSVSKMSAYSVSNLISACAANDGAKENYSCSPRKRKEKETKKKSKKRYCEICDVYFSDIETHLDDKSHEKYMNDEKHFGVVQDVISNLRQADDFISSIYEAEEREKEKIPQDYLPDVNPSSGVLFDSENASPVEEQNGSPLEEQEVDNCMTELYSVNPNDYISASCSSADTTPFPFLEYMHNNNGVNSNYNDMKPPTLVYYNSIENSNPVFTPQKYEMKSIEPYCDTFEKDAFDTFNRNLVIDFQTDILNKVNDSRFKRDLSKDFQAHTVNKINDFDLSSAKPESNYGSGSNSCDAQISENRILVSTHIEGLLPVTTNGITNSQMSNIIIDTVNLQNPAQLSDEGIVDSVIESVPMCDDENSDTNLYCGEQNIMNEVCVNVYQHKDPLSKNDGAAESMSNTEFGVESNLNPLIPPVSANSLECNNAPDCIFPEQPSAQNKQVERDIDCQVIELKLNNLETEISTDSDSAQDRLQVKTSIDTDAPKSETEICLKPNFKILPTDVFQALSGTSINETVLTVFNEINEDFKELYDETCANDHVANSRNACSSVSENQDQNVNSCNENSTSCNFTTCETTTYDHIPSNEEGQNSEIANPVTETVNCETTLIPGESQFSDSEQNSITNLGSLPPADTKHAEASDLRNEIDLINVSINISAKSIALVQYDSSSFFNEKSLSSNNVNFNLNKNVDNIVPCLDLSYRESFQNMAESNSVDMSSHKHEILTALDMRLQNSVKKEETKIMNEVTETLNNVLQSAVMLTDEAIDSATIQVSTNYIHACEKEDHLQCSLISSSTLKNNVERNTSVFNENLNLQNVGNENINISSTSVSCDLIQTCEPLAVRSEGENDHQTVCNSNSFEPHFQESEGMEVGKVNLHQVSGHSIDVKEVSTNILLNANNGINYSEGYNLDNCDTCKTPVTVFFQEEGYSNLCTHVTSKYDFAKNPITFQKFINKMQVSPNTASEMWNNSEVFYVLDETSEGSDYCEMEYSTNDNVVHVTSSVNPNNDHYYEMEHSTNDNVVEVTSGVVPEGDNGHYCKMECSTNDNVINVTSCAIPYHINNPSAVCAEFTGSFTCPMECVTNPLPLDHSIEAASIPTEHSSFEAPLIQQSINGVKECMSVSSGENNSLACSPNTTFEQSAVFPSSNVIQDTQRIVHIVYLNSPSEIQKQENEKTPVDCKNHNVLPQSLSTSNSSSSSCKRKLSFSQSEEVDSFSSPEKDNTWATIHHEVDSICKFIDSEEDFPLNLSRDSDKPDHTILLIQK